MVPRFSRDSPEGDRRRMGRRMGTMKTEDDGDWVSQQEARGVPKEVPLHVQILNEEYIRQLSERTAEVIPGVDGRSTGRRGRHGDEGGDGEAHYVNVDAIPRVGDKTRRYAALRQKYDAMFPAFGDDVASRTKRVASSLRHRSYGTFLESADCPLHPAPGYPAAWNVTEVLSHWPPDDVTPRDTIYRSICVFDGTTESDQALNYRRAEVPFVVRDDPTVLRTVERWNHPDYLTTLLGRVPHRTEYSDNNHFMYWMLRPTPTGHQLRGHHPPPQNVPEGWKAPTEMIQMTFPEWLAKANVTTTTKTTIDDKDEGGDGTEAFGKKQKPRRAAQRDDAPSHGVGPNDPHWYFRLIGCDG